MQQTKSPRPKMKVSHLIQFASLHVKERKNAIAIVKALQDLRALDTRKIEFDVDLNKLAASESSQTSPPQQG